MMERLKAALGAIGTPSDCFSLPYRSRNITRQDELRPSIRRVESAEPKANTLPPYSPGSVWDLRARSEEMTRSQSEPVDLNRAYSRPLPKLP